jgi:LysR family transcriptional regulator, glycine cleavage system transcriptional activator
MRELPPLNALLAFEIVARTGSVRSAANELFVTPGAISRQIRLLEDHFGVPLFARQGRGLGLTSIGAAYYERVTTNFDGLRRASALLHSSSGRSVLRLRSYTTFATRWLIPRLSQFQLAHPEIDVRLTTASEWSDLGDFDAAIRLGDGQWPDLDAIPLVPNVLTPVCSPTLLEPDGSMDVARLAEQTIFFVRARPQDWALWCKAAGLEINFFKRRRELESSALAYRAASEGRGVALAQLVLVTDELKTGALVAPIDVSLDLAHFTYHLVSAPRSQKQTTLDQLRLWLTTGEEA